MRARGRILPYLVMLVAFGVACAVPARAADPVVKCRGAIVKGANQYLLYHAKASVNCESRVIRGKLSPGACPDAKAMAMTEKARAKLWGTINKVCGGRDKLCGGSELDIGLLEIGWSIGSCDQTGATSCTGAITDCGGIATCVACIAEHGVADALALFDDRPIVNPVVEKTFVKCLDAIGTSSAKSFMKVAKGLGECWLKVSEAGSGGSFSCPNRRAAVAAGQGRSANVERICDACGGPKGKCGGGDDFAPAALGFPATCPAIGTCGGLVQTLKDVANCADCVTHAIMDTAVRRTLPQFATAPPPCMP
jgi:hypothetical protein